MDSRSLNFKRVTIFAGHYGSGKTNIAVNYALAIKEQGHSATIADLDIVNPYFRTKDSANLLNKAGIRLISSEYANTNVDTPALPAEIYSAFADKSSMAVIDVGGDDRGALALGRYAPLILEENDYEMLFVINRYRFMTSDAKSTVEVMHEIESAAGIRFTGIVNNSNIGEETTAEAVLNGIAYADEVSHITGLPIKMTTVKKELYDELKIKINNLQSIELPVRQSWLRQEEKQWQR